jgi:hypothetical protein
MELELLSTMMKARTSYVLVMSYIKPKNYSTEFNYLLKQIGEYYGRDRQAPHVSPEILKQQLASVLDNEKHVAHFSSMVDRAAGIDTSSANVEEVILAARRHEIETQLAAAFAGGVKAGNVEELLEEHASLRKARTLLDIDGDEPIQVIENIDAETLFARRNRDNLLPVYPQSLNNRLDGGVEGGDHILIYGLTELGKSAMGITFACGFANAGFNGLYFINEDKTERMAERFVCNLSGWDKYRVRDNPQEANARAYKNGLGNIRVIGLHPGSNRQIEALVERYEARWFVVDQVRNLMTPTKGNRVIQLEEAATGVRNTAKKLNAVGVSISQAADSARNKPFLDTGDVDFSNVGIPSTADVMIGFGADDGMQQRGERGISLAKNKVSGNHDQFYVKINPALSKVLDI